MTCTKPSLCCIDIYVGRMYHRDLTSSMFANSKLFHRDLELVIFSNMAVHANMERPLIELCRSCSGWMVQSQMHTPLMNNHQWDVMCMGANQGDHVILNCTA